jgi:hypothetical protein
MERNMEKDNWNPEYLAYCRSKGNVEPEDQLAFDSAAYAGQSMNGFIRWTNEHLTKFAKIIKTDCFSMDIDDRLNYRKWLDRLYPMKEAA